MLNVQGRHLGFTLIECITVILLIGILTAAYFSIRTPSQDLSLNFLSFQIASDLVQAQSLAMSLSQSVQVSPLSSNSYSITDAYNRPLWINSNAITLPQNSSFSTPLPSVFQFNSRGIPSTSTGRLSSNWMIQINASTGERRIISVAPYTGYVQVQIP